MNQDSGNPGNSDNGSEEATDHKPDDSGREPYDPRPVSDAELRDEYSREEVERWRQEADDYHSQWFSVMENDYGRD